MTGVPIPTESIGRIDLLLGRATMLTADRWDDVARMIQEAMGIALFMAALHPSECRANVPGLGRLNVTECVDHALREVESWDLALAADLPDLARLRVLLSDLRRELAPTVGREG